MALSANAGSLIPTFQPDEITHRRRIAAWAIATNQGHIQNTGMVTLGTSVATTVITDSRVGGSSFIGLMPVTSDASAAGAYVSSQSQGAFTITHPNNSQNDRTFRYCILGQ